MIEIHRKEIVLDTDEGEIRLLFCPQQPRGYTELMKAIGAFEKMRERALELSKGDQRLAAAFAIDGEMRSLEQMKEALRTALAPAEWEKISPIVDFVDIRGMLSIVTAILNEYVRYYEDRLKKGMEE